MNHGQPNAIQSKFYWQRRNCKTCDNETASNINVINYHDERAFNYGYNTQASGISATQPGQGTIQVQADKEYIHAT